MSYKEDGWKLKYIMGRGMTLVLTEETCKRHKRHGKHVPSDSTVSLWVGQETWQNKGSDLRIFYTMSLVTLYLIKYFRFVFIYMVSTSCGSLITAHTNILYFRYDTLWGQTRDTRDMLGGIEYYG